MMKLCDRKYLNLLREMAVAQYKLKDQSTFFGFFWSFLNPLIMVSVLFVFFNLSIGQQIEHYVIYLLIGIIHYTHFSNSTGASMQVLYVMRNLTRDTVFPKEVLVIGSLMSTAIEFILSMLICLVIASFSGLHMTWAVVMLPFVLVLQLMLVLWVSLLLSCFYIYVRDIAHIYQVFLRLLFFATPIFYSLSFLGDGISSYVVFLNPLTHLIIFSRTILIEGSPISVKLLSLLFVVNMSLIYLSFKTLKFFEPTFAENV
jgi:ABC-type polysaccharide/polyol phosphate export permease